MAVQHGDADTLACNHRPLCGHDCAVQVALDVDFEKGMGVSVGRLREDTVYDYKFVGLSHNTR